MLADSMPLLHAPKTTGAGDAMLIVDDDPERYAAETVRAADLMKALLYARAVGPEAPLP